MPPLTHIKTMKIISTPHLRGQEEGEAICKGGLPHGAPCRLCWRGRPVGVNLAARGVPRRQRPHARGACVAGLRTAYRRGVKALAAQPCPGGQEQAATAARRQQPGQPAHDRSNPLRDHQPEGRLPLASFPPQHTCSTHAGPPAYRTSRAGVPRYLESQSAAAAPSSSPSPLQPHTVTGTRGLRGPPAPSGTCAGGEARPRCQPCTRATARHGGLQPRSVCRSPAAMP